MGLSVLSYLALDHSEVDGIRHLDGPLVYIREHHHLRPETETFPVSVMRFRLILENAVSYQ